MAIFSVCTIVSLILSFVCLFSGNVYPDRGLVDLESFPGILGMRREYILDIITDVNPPLGNNTHGQLSIANPPTSTLFGKPGKKKKN